MTTRQVTNRPWAVWRLDGVPQPFIVATFADRAWAEATAGAMNDDLHEVGRPRPVVFGVRVRGRRTKPVRITA